jgi:hypothetical protein
MVKFSLRLLAIGAVTAAIAAAQGGSYKVAVATAGPPADVASSVQLDPHALTVTNSQGTQLAQIWLLEGVPAKQASASGDIAFPGLSVGTLVAVVRFPSDWSDFRGTPIKAGTYTLRYGLHPEDGNHMGVSTYRDFLLLVPAAQDTSGARALSYDDLVKASKLATGKPHPAVMALAPVSGQSLPDVVTDDQGFVTVEAKLQTNVGGQKQSLPIGMTLVGKSDVR